MWVGFIPSVESFKRKNKTNYNPEGSSRKKNFASTMWYQSLPKFLSGFFFFPTLKIWSPLLCCFLYIFIGLLNYLPIHPPIYSSSHFVYPFFQQSHPSQQASPRLLKPESLKAGQPPVFASETCFLPTIHLISRLHPTPSPSVVCTSSVYLHRCSTPVHEAH